MRELTDHIVPGDAMNHQLKVKALDGPGPGNASHKYEISWDKTPNYNEGIILGFQNGPIKEAGVNGVSAESLMAICIDRLRGFQSGPYACKENQNQLNHLEKALYWAQHRTRQRIARGVEGTHEK
jgi:hypothetical protein